MTGSRVEGDAIVVDVDLTAELGFVLLSYA